MEMSWKLSLYMSLPFPVFIQVCRLYIYIHIYICICKAVMGIMQSIHTRLQCDLSV